MPHCVTLRVLTTHLRIVSVPPMSDALTVTLPDSTRPAAPTAGRGRLRVDPTALATLAMLALCMTAGAVLLRDRAPASDDGAGSVPVIALIGIAVAITRWHPRSGEVPVRGIAPSVALAIGGAAGLLLAGLVVPPAARGSHLPATRAVRALRCPGRTVASLHGLPPSGLTRGDRHPRARDRSQSLEGLGPGPRRPGTDDGRR